MTIDLVHGVRLDDVERLRSEPSRAARGGARALAASARCLRARRASTSGGRHVLGLEVDRRRRPRCASTRTRWKRSRWRSSRPGHGRTCSRSRRAGPSSKSREARPPRAARGGAPASSVSPASTPPPGVIHQLVAGDRVLEAHQQHALARRRRRARAPPSRGTGSSQSWSARNQRSRSAYGTAAFAGEVDGRTKSAVVAERRAVCGPSSGRSPKTPR